MVRRCLAVLCAMALVTSGVMTLVGTPSTALAGKKAAPKLPLAKLPVDPNAEEVELFAAMKDGQVTAKLIPKNALGGNVLIENLTGKPLNVKLPDAVVAVPKHLAQFGGGMGGMGGMGGGGMGGMGGGMGGGQQPMGGGMGGMGGGGMGGAGGGGFMGGGGGFGSIPPETVATVPMSSVCLAHGKAEPTSRSEYVLIPVDQFSNDPALHELLKVVGTGKVDAQAAQAAAWHITDRMSFDQLANKAVQHTGGLPPTPYFSRQQLLSAQSLLSYVYEQAEKHPKPEPAPRPESIRTGRVSAAR